MGQFGRRQFLIAASASFAAQFARAQQPGRTYRVGALFAPGAEAMQQYRSALSEGLSTHGFVEGRNLRIEHRSSGFGTAEAQNAVTALLALNPDALFILLVSGTRAAQSVTRTVPIVFAWVTDPVGSGLVKSYALPGGNITGVTNRYVELVVKRLEFARELVPDVKRVAVAWAVGLRYQEVAPQFRSAAKQLGIDLIELGLMGPENTVAHAARGGAEVIIPFPQYTSFGYRAHGEQVARAALERRIPVIFAGAEMVEAGGLMSYGTNIVDDVRRGADLLARVLKGEKPANLPVDQAARFELAVNLKTAKAIGITIPPSIMLRADTVIE